MNTLLSLSAPYDGGVRECSAVVKKLQNFEVQVCKLSTSVWMWYVWRGWMAGVLMVGHEWATLAD